MHTEVELRDIFSYSLAFDVALLIMILLPPIAWLLVKLVKIIIEKISDKPKTVKEVKYKKVKLDKYKKRTLLLIEKVEGKYKNNKLSDREVFIELSYVVRRFVDRVLRLNTAKLSLTEIEELGVFELYNVIKKYYEVEFGEDCVINEENDPFKDARKVIDEWN